MTADIDAERNPAEWQDLALRASDNHYIDASLEAVSNMQHSSNISGSSFKPKLAGTDSASSASEQSEIEAAAVGETSAAGATREARRSERRLAKAKRGERGSARQTDVDDSPTVSAGWIVAGRCIMAVAQTGAGVLSIIGANEEDADLKSKFKSAAGMCALLGYVGGNTAVDAFDKLIEKRSKVLQRKLEVTMQGDERLSRVAGQARIRSLAKAQVAVWKDLPTSIFSAGGAVTAAFVERDNAWISGGAVGGTLVGAAAGCLITRFATCRQLTQITNAENQATFMQMTAAVGCLVGLCIAIAATENDGWIAELFTESSGFMTAAIPPLACILQSIVPAGRYLNAYVNKSKAPAVVEQVRGQVATFAAVGLSTVNRGEGLNDLERRYLDVRQASEDTV